MAKLECRFFFSIVLAALDSCQFAALVRYGTVSWMGGGTRAVRYVESGVMEKFAVAMESFFSAGLIFSCLSWLNRAKVPADYVTARISKILQHVYDVPDS